MLNFFARSGAKIEKIDSLCPGRGRARLARAGEGSSHVYLALNTLRENGLKMRAQAAETMFQQRAKGASFKFALSSLTLSAKHATIHG